MLGRDLDQALAIQATERLRRSAVEARAALFARIAAGEAVDPAALAAATEAVAAAEGRTAAPPWLGDERLVPFRPDTLGGAGDDPTVTAQAVALGLTLN